MSDQEEQNYEEPQEEEEQQYEEPQQEEEQQYDEPEPQEEEPEPEYKEPEPEPSPPQDQSPEPQQNYGGGGGDLPATVKAACDDIYSDTPSFNFFTTTLVDPKLKDTTLQVNSIGKGGLNELKSYMANQADSIMFFMLRCDTYDKESSIRAKFVYGRFVGSKVKFMQKAKLTPNLGAMADQFQVKHLSKDADENMQDWTPEKLGKEFLRIGGAHKPSKYDFGPNAVYEV